ncbi:MAG: hypothetical protein ACREIH_02040 [Nitrospiraceae bacterium]
MSQTLLKISQIGLCDEISYGQFGKANLIGFNPGYVLTISDIPYRLQTNLIVSGECLTANEMDVMRTSTQLLGSSGSVLFESTEEFSLPEVSAGSEPRPFIIGYPLDLTIPDYGRLRVSIFGGGVEVIRKEIRVVKGLAPSVAPTARISSSDILDSQHGITLDSVLKSANRSLVLIDKYLGPKALRELLEITPSNCQVMLLAGSKLKQRYIKDLQNNGPFARKVEVRFGEPFHDRFIIVNDSEYFHFGHSFMALWAGPLSRYSKLFRSDEITKLSSAFGIEWAKTERI